MALNKKNYPSKFQPSTFIRQHASRPTGVKGGISALGILAVAVWLS